MDTEYPLKQLYFYLTGECNLRCSHCWISPAHRVPGKASRYLDKALFLSIIQQAKLLGISCVKLTGGEPLLHPHIHTILEMLRAHGLTVHIETNGVLCTAKMARRIAACRDPFVSVSLDGSRASTHDAVRGVKGAFRAAVDGLRNLVAAGLRPQIIMSLLACNRDQLGEIAQLAESLGAGSVKFNLVQPIGRGRRLHEEGKTLGIRELVSIGEWVERTLSHSTELPIHFGHPPAFRPLSRILDPKEGGCHVCNVLNILGVLSDGSYALCGIGVTLPEMVFGHAAQDSLEGVWRDTELLNQLRANLPARLKGVCSRCLLKHICLGGCLAQSYHDTRDLWGPFWYCREALRSQVFPASRLNG